MRRATVVCWVCGIVMSLSACAPGAQAPTENSTPGSSAPATPVVPGPSSPAGPQDSPSASGSTTASGTTLDGDWVLWTRGATCANLDGGVLTVAGSAADFAEGGPDATTALTGSAGLNGTTFTASLQRTTPSRDALDLHGAPGSDGTISGKGEAGGIHPGGETGYSCTFRYTLERIGPNPGDACTAAAVQAGVIASTAFRPVRIRSATVRCADGWATATVVNVQAEGDYYVVVQSNGTAWVRRSLSRSCGWKHPLQPRPLPWALARSICGG